MKVFLSESIVDYNTYTFNYTVYALKESMEDLTEIYDRGFLPYTGRTDLEREIFYLARSLRVNLANFSDTSENRRVQRMVEPLEIEVKLWAKSDFDLKNPVFVGFCEDYINERIGESHMSHERLEYILSRESATHIFEFKNKNQILGYVLAVMNEDLVHYWFAFFDTEYMRSHSLGKWMMWKVISWAKENGRKYAYLGTAYKSAALYKIRDHKGLEYWDGAGWSEDVKRLKEWCKTDLEPKEGDRFKALEDSDKFLSSL